MEGHDAITRLELGDILADLVDDAGNVVARVARLVEPFGQLPVLWVGAADDDLDD